MHKRTMGKSNRRGLERERERERERVFRELFIYLFIFILWTRMVT